MQGTSLKLGSIGITSIYVVFRKKCHRLVRKLFSYSFSRQCKCISHFLKFILLLLELFLAMKFDMSAMSVSTTKHCKIQAYNMYKFCLYRYLGHGRFVEGGRGSKQKRPSDVAGEKIDMFVAPYTKRFSSLLCIEIYGRFRSVNGDLERVFSAMLSFCTLISL